MVTSARFRRRSPPRSGVSCPSMWRTAVQSLARSTTASWPRIPSSAAATMGAMSSSGVSDATPSR